MPTSSNTNSPFNVLLLSLSIFSGYNRSSGEYGVSESSFEIDGERFSYFYQMEPVPRKLIKELGHLDHVIMLATEKTRSPASIVLKNGGGEIVCKETISPEDFMRNRLMSFLSSDLPSDSLFETLDINEQNPEKGIGDTVKYLRTLKRQHPDLHLYVDVHGGFRDTSLILEALLSLLKSEITVQNIYTVRYVNNTAAIEIDSSTKIFDFVSGINEFTQYGRIDSLQRYYKDNDDPSIQELMTHIERIAAGIQLCNIPMFERGLNNLKAYFDNSSSTLENSSDEASPLQYLELFRDTIRTDYGELLRTDRTAIQEIRWCLGKGFYQQCLTLIESKMPEDMFRIGLFNYDEATLGQYADTHRGYDSKNLYIFNNTFPSSIKRAFNEAYSNDRTRNYRRHTRFENRLLSYLGNETYLNIRESGALRNELYFFRHTLSFSTQEEQATRTYPVRLKNENITDLFSFFVLHTALKRLRNFSNHAGNSNVNISIASIKTAIQTYIQWYEEFENNV